MMKREKEKKPLHILIAEDDPDDQFIFETALRELAPDALIRFFYTSQGLIHHLVRAGIQDEPSAMPDLIIGDMKQPFFELKDIAEIRTYKQFEKIPVYVFAEGYADVTRSNALALGASGFYHKPNSLHLLKDILQQILTKKNAPIHIKGIDLSNLSKMTWKPAAEKTTQQEEEE